MSEVGTIVKALYDFLIAHLQGDETRRFFRLDGFEEPVYQGLLTLFDSNDNKLASCSLWVRTTGPIPGYESYTLERGRSATWYRNHVPSGCALILIFNQRTSDAQSLKDIYPVTESLLTTEGLSQLISAAFTDYELSPSQTEILTNFLDRLRKVLFQPQLRDLVAFLNTLNTRLDTRPERTMEAAIAESLPQLGLFRCHKFTTEINTSKGDRLLRDLYKTARLGRELLDERHLATHLSRLEEADFDDESSDGGLSAEEKRDLLYRFLTEVITDRADILDVLQLDWEEVAPILYKRRRKTRAEQRQELATALEEALQSQGLEQDARPDSVQDLLQDLSDGEEPEDEGLDILLTSYSDSLPRSLQNKLRRLWGITRFKTTDFIAGVTYLAMELLTPFQDDSVAETSLIVSFNEQSLGPVTRKEAEALLAFRTLYGGIEAMMPQIQWDLEDIWDLSCQHGSLVGEEEANEEGEREKIIRIPLTFHVTVASRDEDLTRAELIWHYRSDGPAAATLAHLRAEFRRLTEQDTTELDAKDSIARLSIPIYNNCPAGDEISDLDLSRPVVSLGAWYRDTNDLGKLLRDDLAPRLRPETWAIFEEAIGQLETAWASFIRDTAEKGNLAADLYSFLQAYDNLMCTASEHVQTGQGILRGFRLLIQAWVVGPETFDEWAVLPFLHPVKLHWWQTRTRIFNGVLSRLLSTDDPAPVVDDRRFRKELNVTYGSANYPAVVALPGRDRRPDYFLPVHEMEGYELFRHSGQVGIAYGLDPDLVSEGEGEQAAGAAAQELARVVQDYIETYPFVRDGLEVYIVQCRNGALPGLLVEQLDTLARRRRWGIHLSIIVHSTERGAPLYRRVTEWLETHDKFTSRPSDSYFPPVTLRVLECEYDDLFHEIDKTDLVILPDLLAEQGHIVEATFSEEQASASIDDLSLYRVQQAPFERGELTRAVLLTPSSQPSFLQHFYALQWAACERKALPIRRTISFQQVVSLQDWEQELAELHRRFNWVACYDTTVDRFLLEDSFPNTVEVIRYSLGLGIKRRHNLTVSSSYQTRDIVERRLTVNLETLLPGTPEEFRCQVAERLVEEAKQVSGDIVLRAAGPGAYLNELIGVVAAKHQTAKRYLSQHPGALTAWIYLDDFAHWFDHRTPDLLFVAIPPEANGELPLHIEVLEAKCIGESSFASEAADAQRQVAQGINRLARAWAPEGIHLDAPFWYDQLYRAVVGNLAVKQEQRRLWEAFRRRLPQGDYDLEIGGHAWVFCHNSSAGIIGLRDEGEAAIVAPDAQNVAHYYHHYGRTGLRQLLRNLVEEWKLEAPADTWLPIHDEFASSSVEAEEPQEAKAKRVVPPDLPTEATSIKGATQLEENLPEEWLQENTERLTRVLRDYGLHIYPVESSKADIGPSIVRFKVRLRPGEKLGRLQSIAEDLQRELATTAVPLIDNVVGTRYVGVDLPRPEPKAVMLLDALSSLPDASIGRLPFLVGRTPAGRTVTADLADLPHLLVAGSTGSGKTVFLYSLIINLLHQFSPEDLSLLLIDPKQTDFVYFEGLPHLLGGQVVIDAEEAIAYLGQLTTEVMEARTHQLRKARCRDISDYNSRHPDNPLVPIVVAIDEYADLVQTLDRGGRQEFERRLVRLAQRARNIGIHLVIATQRPSADIVTTSLKTNLPARIAFRLPSYHDSMTILDQTGAENLLGKGDMLFLHSGKVERLQGFYISPDTLDKWVRSHRSKLQ